jgi:hypothetical protein
MLIIGVIPTPALVSGANFNPETARIKIQFYGASLPIVVSFA